MPLIKAELPVLLPTELRMNTLYRKIFYEWAYTLIMFAIPFTILIVVNTLVIIAVHRLFFKSCWRTFDLFDHFNSCLFSDLFEILLPNI